MALDPSNSSSLEQLALKGLKDAFSCNLWLEPELLNVDNIK